MKFWQFFDYVGFGISRREAERRIDLASQENPHEVDAAPRAADAARKAESRHLAGFTTVNLSQDCGSTLAYAAPRRGRSLGRRLSRQCNFSPVPSGAFCCQRSAGALALSVASQGFGLPWNPRLVRLGAEALVQANRAWCRAALPTFPNGQTL